MIVPTYAELLAHCEMHAHTRASPTASVVYAPRLMNEARAPMLDQVNLVVGDVPASIAFYRRLGLVIEEVPHPDWARHHATAIMANVMKTRLTHGKFPHFRSSA